MAPGGLVKDPVSAISLGVALIFGTAGLPHILMRFFTVADARQARLSVLVATGFITVFYSLLFVLGFGAIALVLADPAFKDAAGNLIGGTNMVALHLADRLGGSLLLGFISAVAFATILAVVSGLTIAGASAASHDLYARVLRRGAASEQKEVRVSKAAAVVLSLTAMGLAMLFENQNIAFVVGLVFAIAASANFPVLLLSVTWRGLTTRGAVAGLARGPARRAPPGRAQPRRLDGDPEAGAGAVPLRQPGAVLGAAGVRWSPGWSRTSTAASPARPSAPPSPPSTSSPRPASAGRRTCLSLSRTERRSCPNHHPPWPQAPSAWPADSAASSPSAPATARSAAAWSRRTDRVRVWHLHLQPGQRIGFHTHVLDYFWTALTAGAARSHYHDGRIVEVSYTAGDTQHHRYGPGEFMIHDLENIGATELVFATVEFLDSANPRCAVPRQSSGLHQAQPEPCKRLGRSCPTASAQVASTGRVNYSIYTSIIIWNEFCYTLV